MDPLDTIKFEKDTSYFLMQGARHHQMRVFHCLPQDLFLLNSDLSVHAQEVIPYPYEAENTGFEQVKNQGIVSFQDLQFVVIRKDPPFDEAYLAMTQLLDFAPKTCRVVNSPQALRDFNEKLFAIKFSEYIPQTMITSGFRDLVSFSKAHKKIVLKPMDGFGGKGIHIIDSSEVHKFESLFSGKEYVIQEFVEAAKDGDKRIILLNGEPLGAILRKADQPGQLNNLDQGGKAYRAELTKTDKEICGAMKSVFLDKDLFFVGIDVLGDRLTEINVTSPTGLQELSRFEGKNFANKVIEELIK